MFKLYNKSNYFMRHNLITVTSPVKNELAKICCYLKMCEFILYLINKV